MSRPLMWLLIGLSVIGLAIALERTIIMFATRDDVHRLEQDVDLDREGGEQPVERHHLAPVVAVELLPVRRVERVGVEPLALRHLEDEVLDEVGGEQRQPVAQRGAEWGGVVRVGQTVEQAGEPL